jgi:hypothetical protein
MGDMSEIEPLRCILLGFILIAIFWLGAAFHASLRPITAMRAYRRMKAHCAAVIEALQREAVERQNRIEQLEFELLKREDY